WAGGGGGGAGGPGCPRNHGAGGGRAVSPAAVAGRFLGSQHIGKLVEVAVRRWQRQRHRYGRTSASVCCAIISSSLVGITQTDAALPGAEICGPFLAFACSSNLMPSHARFLQSAARTRGECSPMPAVNTNASRPPSTAA